MSLKDYFSRWTQSQMDAALDDAGPIPPEPSTVSINAHKVHIGDVHNHAAPDGPERITEPQSRLLKSLVGRIGKAERARNPAYNDARTWTKANRLAGVDHHRDIPKRRFDEVKEFLEEWLRRLG